MEQIWLNELKENKNLKIDDVERSIRYSRDLIHGLEKVKSYPQGVTVFGSARLPESNHYYQLARDLGQKLAKANVPVITGGGPGIMEAANRGAMEMNGTSIGLNIHLETEQDLNKYTTDSMGFHYFFARKVMLTFSAKVYVFFPGGFGTLDEFSEVLELRHTAKIPPAPLFLVGKEFWQGLDDWFGQKMSEWHLIETGQQGEFNETGAADAGITKNARQLYTITDDVNEIVEAAIRTPGHDVSQVIAGVSPQSGVDHSGEAL